MPPLHTFVVVVFSCLALIIALYCLFFMVPVKRFWERVRTLGGGIKGIEAHVNGVRESISRQVEGLRQESREQAEAQRAEFEQKLEELARDGRKGRRRLETLADEIETTRQQLKSTAGELRKVMRNMEALSRNVQQLRSDFDTLDVEVRESVRQQVGNSFSTVESTVLSALEAVQEEILYGVCGDGSGPPHREPPPTGTGPGARRTRDKIMKLEPLFEAGRGGRKKAREKTDDESEPGRKEGETEPDKEGGD